MGRVAQKISPISEFNGVGGGDVRNGPTPRMDMTWRSKWAASPFSHRALAEWERVEITERSERAVEINVAPVFVTARDERGDCLTPAHRASALALCITASEGL